MLEDVGAAGQRKEEAVDGAPEVGGVADVVHVALGHIPAVKEVKRCEDVARNRDGNEVDVDTHFRLKENRGEKDGRNGSGSAHSTVIPIVFILNQVPDGGHNDGRHLQDYIEYNAQRTAESQLEVLFHYPAEEEQGEHVEEQVPPAAVDCTVGQHPVPFLPVPD